MPAASIAFLDVILRASDNRAPQQRDETHDDDRGLRSVGLFVDEVGAGDQVDTSRHHRRRVDQRGHWRRAFHGIEKPALQRNLSRLAAGCQQEQQPERRCRAVRD
jgi:hypothetical protein